MTGMELTADHIDTFFHYSLRAVVLVCALGIVASLAALLLGYS